MSPIAKDSPRLSFIKRKPISLNQQEFVSTRFLNGTEGVPLIIEPCIEGLELAWWISGKRDFLETALRQYGAILFRGFGLRTQADFAAPLAALQDGLMEYTEGATPRTRVGDRVYTSTEFPPEHPIALHNELSYVNIWPMKLFFFCMVAPTVGGATPLADMRKVYRRIPAEILQRFEQKGWRLVRNYGIGFGPSWQESFHAQTREMVEAYCQQADVGMEWLENDRLRTRHVRPAVRRHPKTGEPVWFNHVAFWHLSSLPEDIQRRFRADFQEGEYPYNTYYGDGTPIEDSVVGALREAYDAESVSFPWQEGDFLMVDNMLVAHGREAFSGARRILVAMGEPMSSTEAL